MNEQKNGRDPRKKRIRSIKRKSCDSFRAEKSQGSHRENHKKRTKNRNKWHTNVVPTKNPAEKKNMGEKRQKLSCLYDACPKLLLLTIKNYHKYSVFMSEFRSRARRAERAHTRELSRRLTTLLVVKRARIFFGTTTNCKTMTTTILEMAIK